MSPESTRHGGSGSFALTQKRRPRAIGYVSTLAHAPIDVLDARNQTARIEHACAHRAWTLVGVTRDVDLNGASAASRPALEYALRQLEQDAVDRLIVVHLERLCSSIAALSDILDHVVRHGAHLLCLEPMIDTASDGGSTAIRALIRMSRWERDRLAERTRTGLAAARRSRARSRPAVEDRPELEDRIVALRADGMTFQEIADVLNAEQVPTLRGGREWRPSSLQVTINRSIRRTGAGRRDAPGSERRVR